MAKKGHTFSSGKNHCFICLPIRRLILLSHGEALGFPREEFALTGSICKPSPQTKQPFAIFLASFSKVPAAPKWEDQGEFLFVTPGTVAHKAPLSMEFSRQECRSRLPFHWQGDSSPLSHQGSLFAELRARPGKRSLTILLKINKHFRSRDFFYEYWNIETFPSQDGCKLCIFVLKKMLIGWGMRESFSHYFPPV